MQYIKIYICGQEEGRKTAGKCHRIHQQAAFSSRQKSPLFSMLVGMFFVRKTEITKPLLKVHLGSCLLIIIFRMHKQGSMEESLYTVILSEKPVLDLDPSVHCVQLLLYNPKPDFSCVKEIYKSLC
jgi:hypothetical protein